MSRFPIALWLAVAGCCLAGGAGCCCCERGFALSGDWSLQMDRLPNDCDSCGSGHCAPGAGGLVNHQSDAVPVSAAPTTSPRFHPLPTAPVGDVTAPHAVGMPPAIHSPAGYASEPKLASVLQREEPSAPAESSWMFVRGSRPSHASSAELAQRRQLTAEAWTPTRRR